MVSTGLMKKADVNSWIWSSDWWFVAWVPQKSDGLEILTDWWYTYPSEKYDFVSGDDEIPNWMERHNPNFMVQKHLPDNILSFSTMINHY